MVDVAIVGAGLAGLCCALRLREIGISFQIFEASDAVGGQVRTITHGGGFRVDRSFQPLLTAFPEAQRMLDYGPLDLRPFWRGALIRTGGRFRRFAFPAGLRGLFNPIGSVADAFRMWSLRHKTTAGTLADQFAKPEGLTLDLLRWQGFSDSVIDQFFRPFLGAFFLERDLVTSSRLSRFLFRMLAEGDMAVPNAGLGAIAEQLERRLPPGCIRVGVSVDRIEPGCVTLRNGEEIQVRAIVTATEADEAGRLLGSRIRVPKMRTATCFNFLTSNSPLGEPILVLNADPSGPISHLAVMSDVAPGYAPPGAALISAVVLGTPSDGRATLQAVHDQLSQWFGGLSLGTEMLTTSYSIPDQTAPALDPPERPVDLGEGLFVCGQHRDTATMNGAMASGWRAAQAVAEWLA